MYGRHSTTIVGYMYSADIYCPGCILAALPTAQGGQFDGWKDLSNQPVETSLDELAAAFGFDRHDEYSYDSDEFPKVVFAGQVHDGCCELCEHDDDHCERCCIDRCGSCGEQL
jgi:hypothetical protein